MKEMFLIIASIIAFLILVWGIAQSHKEEVALINGIFKKLDELQMRFPVPVK